MSFRCELCEKATLNGIPAFIIPVRKRKREYHYFNKKTKQPRISKGWEIEREIKICPKCRKGIESAQKEVHPRSTDSKGQN